MSGYFSPTRSNPDLSDFQWAADSGRITFEFLVVDILTHLLERCAVGPGYCFTNAYTLVNVRSRQDGKVTTNTVRATDAAWGWTIVCFQVDFLVPRGPFGGIANLSCTRAPALVVDLLRLRRPEAA
jgi:hypothetical protein